MVEQLEAAATDVVPEPANGDNTNSGNFFMIGGPDSNTDPITIGLGVGLTGCTAHTVVSEKAVCFRHF